MWQSIDPFVSGDRKKIREAITGQMLLGGGIGIAAFLGALGLVVGLWLIGSLLPPESKEADDPTPDSFGFLTETVETARTG